MSLFDDAVNHIKTVKGVVDAYIMDDEFSNRILEEERSVVSITKMDVINNAYEDVMKRHHRIAIIFENHNFEYNRDVASIWMVNSKGDVVGKSLDSQEEIDEYKKDEDNVWVSSNFVIFDLDNVDGGEKFIVPPASFNFLNKLPGYSDAIFASPSTTSDMMLKQKVGSSLSTETSTIVIGFNTVDDLNNQ